jgi:hypothetical protein
MLTSEALAPFEENAGSLVATVALKKTARQHNAPWDDEIGRTNSMGTRQPVPTH